MSLTNLLTLSYWFSISTPPLRRASFIIAIIILVLIFAVGVALRTMARYKKWNPPLSKGLRGLARPCFFFSIFTAILISFRELGAMVVSARFLILLILAITITWFAVILRVMLKNYQTEYNKLQNKWKYEAYLPKKKK